MARTTHREDDCGHETRALKMLRLCQAGPNAGVARRHVMGVRAYASARLLAGSHQPRRWSWSRRRTRSDDRTEHERRIALLLRSQLGAQPKALPDARATLAW